MINDFLLRNNKSIGIVCSVLRKTLWVYTFGYHWQEPDSRILWEAVDHIHRLLFVMDTRTRRNSSLCGSVKYHRKMLTFVNYILISMWNINFKFNREMLPCINQILIPSKNSLYLAYFLEFDEIYYSKVDINLGYEFEYKIFQIQHTRPYNFCCLRIFK